MNKLADQLALVLTTLWVGALWAIGVTAYMLFTTLKGLQSDSQLAGLLAGKLFNLVSYLGLFSGFFLLIHRLIRYGTAALKQAYFWAVFMMLLLVAFGHFGIQPLLAQLKVQAILSGAINGDVMKSVFASRFERWHGIASVAYVLECLLGFVVVLRAKQ